MPERFTVALDFDGTLTADFRGYTGVEVKDPPAPGARRFVEDLILDGYEVVIFSHRAKDASGREAIRQWLDKHDFPSIDVITDRKPAAQVYVDDRAKRFEGDFGDVARFIRSDAALPWTDKAA